MALHYFHLANGRTTLDPKGTDLPDLNSVRKEAIRAMRELLNLGDEDSLWSGEPFRVWVTSKPNGAGTVVLTLELQTERPQTIHRHRRDGKGAGTD
jgi:hypothetical protein